MAKQETLTIFPEIEDTTKMMSNEQFGELMRAVMAYRFRGEEYTGRDVAVNVAFQFMSSQVDRSETAKAARSKAAQGRWTAKGDAEGMQTDAKPMQSDANDMQNDAEGMQTDAPVQSYPVQSSPIQSNKESKADEPPAPAKQAKKSFGVFGWVKLTDDEYNRLLNDLGEAEVKRCIAYVDESAQTTGNKNKWRDWNLVIRKCSRDCWGMKGNSSKSAKTGKRQLDPDEIAAINRMMEGNNEEFS